MLKSLPNQDFHDRLVVKKFACNAGDPGSIPRLEWSAGEQICTGSRYLLPTPVFLAFPYGSAGKKSASNVGHLGSIPGLGRSPREGKDYPLQYFVMENSMDYIVHGVANNQTQLSDFHYTK